MPGLTQYQTHMKQHATWTCKVCGEVFQVNKTFTDTNKPINSCYIFQGRSKYARHYTISHTGTWQCDKCEQCFNNKRSLEIHQKNKHLPDNEKPFRCDRCSKGFAERHKLMRHMKSVHKE